MAGGGQFDMTFSDISHTFKCVHVQFWNFFTFPKYQKQKFWKKINYNCFTPSLLEERELKKCPSCPNDIYPGNIYPVILTIKFWTKSFVGPQFFLTENFIWPYLLFHEKSRSEYYCLPTFQPPTTQTVWIMGKYENEDNLKNEGGSHDFWTIP